MALTPSLGLRTKIALPFAISASALILIGLFSTYTSNNLISNTDAVADRFLPASSAVLNADRDLYQALVAQMAFITAMANNADGQSLTNDFEENSQQALDRMNKAEGLLKGTKVSQELDGFDAAYSAWKKLATTSMQLARDGQSDSASELLNGDSSAAFSTLRDYYDRVGGLADSEAAETARQASTEGQRSGIITLVITAIAVLASIVLFTVFLKLIIGSINTIRRQLDNIAEGEGDLNKRVPVENDDDLGKLASSFNRVLANLQNMIASIQQLSDKLGEGAQNLETAAKDNNKGVERQTDSISMVATAINEMQSAIEEVAGNASRAAEIARTAQDNGDNGGKIIRNSSEQVRRLAGQIATAVTVIRRLSDDSQNITQVLDVIRGIAEQTNLLALNAAIEAARAGEQGRGFAVVADEVRTLAQRTQKSTADIQTMITTLQTGVAEIVSVMETGSTEAEETEKLSAQAEVELVAITEAITHISDINTSVASATEEQTQVVDEINRSITDINDLATDSAKRSGDIDRISDLLADYASELKTQTGRFRV
ncbi:methyl-accepting chemotaxis protein [Marinobacter caseinilyticus]|uniref:methyl-accepting chemotaxis protein n=1 Tax=Marinobacter caseinilyticus TaxID=2692195 RepID=UPI0014080A56|nr:methyl-accepting chemotaxis protein [Marinobacter caseinilyticus]